MNLLEPKPPDRIRRLLPISFDCVCALTQFHVPSLQIYALVLFTFRILRLSISFQFFLSCQIDAHLPSAVLRSTLKLCSKMQYCYFSHRSPCLTFHGSRVSPVNLATGQWFSRVSLPFLPLTPPLNSSGPVDVSNLPEFTTVFMPALSAADRLSVSPDLPQPSLSFGPQLNYWLSPVLCWGLIMEREYNFWCMLMVRAMEIHFFFSKASLSNTSFWLQNSSIDVIIIGFLFIIAWATICLSSTRELILRDLWHNTFITCVWCLLVCGHLSYVQILVISKTNSCQDAASFAPLRTGLGQLICVNLFFIVAHCIYLFLWTSLSEPSK